MADEKKTAEQTAADAAEEAKKSREDAVKEQDNPPEPYPSQEQLNKIQAGETLDEGDEDEAETPAQKRKREEEEKARQQKTMEANKPAPSGGYTTR